MRFRWSSLVIAAVSLGIVLVPVSAKAAESALSASADTESLVLAAQAEDAAAGSGTVFEPKEVVVLFKDGTTKAEADELLGSLAEIATKEVAESDMEQVMPVATLEVADTASVNDAVDALQSSSIVETVSPNYLYKLADDDSQDDAEAEATLDEVAQSGAGTLLTTQSTSVSDPDVAAQYQLGAAAGVDAYDAWSKVKCSHAVTVAVIDTGAMVNHEDLAGNVVDTYNAMSAASSTLKSVTDTAGHGTHVAGIISAVSNNGIGGSGVSYNAGLMIIKASEGGSFEEGTLTNAYNYILANYKTYNVKVINMSLSANLGKDDGSAANNALYKCIDKAWGYGIVTVCAAGNYGTPCYSYPGDYPTCVSVISTNKSGSIASDSNYNINGTDYKNVSAPGKSILSTYISSETTYGYYAFMSGTSMAAPTVSGTLALEFAAKSDLTASEAKAILYETATDVGSSGWDATYGYGRVNAAAAVGVFLDSSDVQAYDASYTGSPITNNVVVKTVAGKVLTPGVDYSVEFSNNVDVGTATVTVTGIHSYSSSGNSATGRGCYGTFTKTFKILDATTVYRLLYPPTNEHLYTTDVNEVRTLVGSRGWTFEGAAWYAPTTGSPVYRLFQPFYGLHHYTSDTYEISVITSQQGWRLDFWGASIFNSGGSIPIYRLFNQYSGQHLFTTDRNEYNVLPTMGWGWQQEGVAMRCLEVGSLGYPMP